MASEGLQLRATARVKLTKLDDNGEVIEVVEQDVELTDEEAAEIWLSHNQA